jgi:hypothetical protein
MPLITRLGRRTEQGYVGAAAGIDAGAQEERGRTVMKPYGGVIDEFELKI